MRQITRRNGLAAVPALFLSRLAPGFPAKRNVNEIADKIGRYDAQALTVEIRFPGGAPTAETLVFEVAKGMDMGDYVAPSGGFRQHCIRVRHDALKNFFVDFRPDLDGERLEVVIWNGECMGSVPSGYHRDLPTYTVTIKSGERALVQKSSPSHSWGCRWRWQSAPRKIIRTAEQVFHDGFLPHMSKKAARIEGYNGVIVPPVPAPVPAYAPFRGPDTREEYKCGLLLPIDTGGERPEIGLITEWQADWLLRGTRTSLDAVMQQAECFAGDMDFYIPDQMTGRPIDYKFDESHYHAYTLGRDYEPQKNYRIYHAEPVNHFRVHEADSHLPNLYLLPFALTEDPYFIEAQQYLLQWTTGWDIYGRQEVYRNLGSRIVCSYTGEIRTLGWGIRNLATTYRITPNNGPSWLAPQSYYGTLSADYSLVINELFTKSTENLHRIFRQMSSDNYWQIFEQSYAIMGMALADLVGLPTGDQPSWKQHLEFYFGFLDGVLNGKSGWDHQVPQPHDIQAADVNTCSSWAEAMLHPKIGQLMKGGARFPNAPSPGNRQGGSMLNCSQILAACACAKSRGIVAANACKAWMDTFIDFNYPNQSDPSMGIAFFARCGFDGDTL